MSDTSTANSKKNTKVNSKQQNSKDKAEKKEKPINKKKHESEDEEEEEEFYIVEKILDYKKQKNRDLFLVKWEGYEELTWEPKSNLSNVKHLVESFLKTLKDKAKRENSENVESSSALQEGSESKKQQLNGGKLQTKEKKSPLAISKEKQAEKIKQDDGSHLKKDVEDNHNISISSMKGKKDDDGEQVEEQDNKVVVKQEEVDEEKQNTKKKEVEQKQKNSQQMEEEEEEQEQEGKDEKQKDKKQQKEEKQDIKHLEQKQNVEDHDEIQQQQKNNLNKKRKKQEQSENDVDEQNEQDKSEEKDKVLLEIPGNLEDHIPQDISKAVYKTLKFQYLVQWKQQQGIKIIPSLICSEDLLKRYGDLIVHFYEDKALKRK
ncbi:hypothetical protein ABPG72_018281 [Tetrahymena utriculariae]